MGADMCIEVVVRCGDATDPARQAAMRTAVAALSAGDFEDTLGDLWEELGYVGTWVGDALGRDPDTLTEAGDDWPARLPPEDRRTLIAKVIEEYFEAHENREVASFGLLGVEIEVTGGMSWGDDATETAVVFRRFRKLSRALLEAGGFALPVGHEEFLSRVIADYPDRLPEPVRQVLDAWRVALKV